MAKTEKVKEFNFNGKPFRIDLNLVTIRMSREMNQVLAEARAKHLTVYDIPMEVGESEAEWRERNREELQQRNTGRRADESPEQHCIRISKSEMKEQDYAIDVINGLGKLFNQPLITQEDLDIVVWPNLKAWIFDVFCEAGVPAGEYDPKSLR